MSSLMLNGHTFEYECDLIEVTSLNRPDPSWKHVCGCGVTHIWYDGDRPATGYSPTTVYTLPTLKKVVTGQGMWDDGTVYDIWHWECITCNEIVKPGSCADSTTQHIAGLKHYRVDGKTVSEKEFTRLLKANQYANVR